jgi:hypothetical protein
MLKPSGGCFKKMFSPEKMAEASKKKKASKHSDKSRSEGPLRKAVNKKVE